MSFTPSGARIPLWAAASLVVMPALPAWGGGDLEAQETDPYEVLAEAARRFAALDALCADFHQTLAVPLLGEEREGRGRLCQKAPDLFRMRFTEPEGDLILVDGSHLWIYYPSQQPDQVVRTGVEGAGGSLDLHREFLEAPRAKYRAEHRGRETLDARPVHRIVLEPTRPVSYREAVVWIDAESFLLRKVEIREENGSIRTVTLSDVELDPDLPPDAFTFEPPPGVRVITR